MSGAARLINVSGQGERAARHDVLARAGFEVLDAGSAREAWDLLQKHRPDLVLLQLPESEAAEMLRRLEGTNGPAVPVLHLTDRESVDSMLLAAVRSMLRQRKAELALAEATAGLEAANEELRRSNEDLKQFAFVASHDLQEPLRTVTTFVQLIEQEAKDRLTEAEKGYFAHVVAGANRMRSLINDLLAYSQVGRKNLSKSTVDMTAVVAWAIENLAGQAAEAGAVVRTDEVMPKVWGDFAQLGQVVQNLLSNAIKYRRPGVPLVVEVRAVETAGPQCVIAVRDNGPGIAAEYQEKIFAPFKRLHGPDIPGTGIGLAVCRRIVDAHGGRIWVESEPGKGSTFFISLPRAPEKEAKVW